MKRNRERESKRQRPSENRADSGFGFFGIAADQLAARRILNTGLLAVEGLIFGAWHPCVCVNVLSFILRSLPSSKSTISIFDLIFVVRQRLIPVISRNGAVSPFFVLHALPLLAQPFQLLLLQLNHFVVGHGLKVSRLPNRLARALLLRSLSRRSPRVALGRLTNAEVRDSLSSVGACAFRTLI